MDKRRIFVVDHAINYFIDDDVRITSRWQNININLYPFQNSTQFHCSVLRSILGKGGILSTNGEVLLSHIGMRRKTMRSIRLPIGDGSESTDCVLCTARRYKGWNILLHIVL